MLHKNTMEDKQQVCSRTVVGDLGLPHLVEELWSPALSDELVHIRSEQSGVWGPLPCRFHWNLARVSGKLSLISSTQEIPV